jgi:hypothetical protein
MRGKLFGAVIAAAAIGCASAAAADPFDGVWVWQPPPGAAPSGNSQVLTITVRGEEEAYLSEQSMANGSRILLPFVVRYDGKPVSTYVYTISKDGVITTRATDVVSRRLQGQDRVVEHWVAGKKVRELRRSAASDGKSIVSEMTDYDAEGKVTRTARLLFARR